jgi:hypothetical protein
MKRILALCLLASAMILAAVAPSLAQGNKATVSLTCGETTYAVTVAGNGNWAPARDEDSTLVFHPTSFSNETSTFTPSDGGDPETVNDPPAEFQAQPQNGHPVLDCSYQFVFECTCGITTGSGDVTGYITGARNN